MLLKKLKDIFFPSGGYAVERCIELLLLYFPPEVAGKLSAELITSYGPIGAISRAKRIAKDAVPLLYDGEEK